jgi:hypothetical protein
MLQIKGILELQATCQLQPKMFSCFDPFSNRHILNAKIKHGSRPIRKVFDKGGRGWEGAHHALIDDLRALGYGLAGVVGDGVSLASSVAWLLASQIRPRRRPHMSSS